MKTISNLFLGSIFALLSAAMLFSCSKTTVEPEPADQVIGSYNGTTYTESINGVAQSIDLTNTSIKENITIEMSVAKKSANIINIVLKISQRDSTGTMQSYTETYDSIELKALGNGSFDMLSVGETIGQIGNGAMKLQETYTDTDDTTGASAQVTVTIAAAKAL